MANSSSSKTLESVHDGLIEGLEVAYYFLISLVLVLSLVWFVYFINNTLLIRKKINYLKHNTHSYKLDRLINALIDYYKSILIVSILFFEILSYLFLIIQGVYGIESQSPNMSCVISFPFDLAYTNIPFRLLLEPSLIICFYISLSLIIILTSYLSKALSNQEIKVRENSKFIWICIETGCILLIHSIWKLYVILGLVVPVLGFIKLFVLFKYIRRLRRVLKDNYVNAHFGSQRYLEANLRRMHSQYIHASRAVFIYACVYIALSATVCVLSRIRLLITSDCVLELLAGSNSSLKYTYVSNLFTWTVIFRLSNIIQNLFLLALILVMVILHLGIFVRLARLRYHNSPRIPNRMCCKKRKRKHVTFADDVQDEPLLRNA